MIEVEKKFLINEAQRKGILEKAVFQKKLIYQDVYYDTSDFFFTTKNVWLRKRNDFFELKVGIKARNTSVDSFDEITDREKIAKYLSLPTTSSLEESVEKRGLFPYCSFRNTRMKYFLDPFVIDIDDANFGDFSYQIAEIELLVNEGLEISKAEERICSLASDLNLDIDRIAKPKLIAYLEKKRPHHYEALIAANITPRFVNDYFVLEEKSGQ